ncbi:hypothetical protein Hanom_Chr09g00768841 [Helianthus anomalus]
MFFPQLKITILLLVQNYDFAPLVCFVCSSQLDYDFALNLNLYFCHRFCFFPIKITIFPPIYNYRHKMGE